MSSQHDASHKSGAAASGDIHAPAGSAGKGGTGGRQGFWPTLIKSARDVVIVLGAFAVITGIALPLALHYAKAGDTTSVLGVILPAISTIAGAAFGISAGTSAGAATGTAVASQAQMETQQKRQQAQDAQKQLHALTTHIDAVAHQLSRLPSPAGTRDFVVGPGQADALQALADPIHVPATSLDSVRDSTSQLERSLQRLAE